MADGAAVTAAEATGTDMPGADIGTQCGAYARLM
jgi:hypothetical protein